MASGGQQLEEEHRSGDRQRSQKGDEHDGGRRPHRSIVGSTPCVLCGLMRFSKKSLKTFRADADTMEQGELIDIEPMPWARSVPMVYRKPPSPPRCQLGLSDGRADRKVRPLCWFSVESGFDRAAPRGGVASTLRCRPRRRPTPLLDPLVAGCRSGGGGLIAPKLPSRTIRNPASVSLQRDFYLEVPFF